MKRNQNRKTENQADQKSLCRGHRRKDEGDGGEKKVIGNNSMVKAFNKALVGKGASRRLHQRCVGRFVFIVSER